MSKSRSSLCGLRGGDGGGVIAAHIMSATNKAMISNAKSMTLYQSWRPLEIGEVPFRAVSSCQDFSATTRLRAARSRGESLRVEEPLKQYRA